MIDIGLGSLLAFSALTLSFVAAKPLGDMNIRVPTIFTAATSLTLIASVVRLAFLNWMVDDPSVHSCCDRFRSDHASGVQARRAGSNGHTRLDWLHRSNCCSHVCGFLV